jgi:hypothetical protein
VCWAREAPRPRPALANTGQMRDRSSELAPLRLLEIGSTEYRSWPQAIPVSCFEGAWPRPGVGGWAGVTTATAVAVVLRVLWALWALWAWYYGHIAVVLWA